MEILNIKFDNIINNVISFPNKNNIRRRDNYKEEKKFVINNFRNNYCTGSSLFKFICVLYAK